MRSTQPTLERRHPLRHQTRRLRNHLPHRRGRDGRGLQSQGYPTGLNRTVAIKLTNEEFQGRFKREARAIAALNHPNVCQLYDVGPNYLVMEHVAGSPVAPVDSLRRLLDLATQIADALSRRACSRHHSSRSQPANILVTAAPGEHANRVKVLDFGLAIDQHPWVTDAGMTTTEAPGLLTAEGTIVGTIAYMSPEQARGQALTPKSDLFAFGVVLYELTAGRHPFVRDSAPETLTAIIREDPPSLPAGVPPPLRWIIERLLAKDPQIATTPLAISIAISGHFAIGPPRPRTLRTPAGAQPTLGGARKRNARERVAVDRSWRCIHGAGRRRCDVESGSTATAAATRRYVCN